MLKRINNLLIFIFSLASICFFVRDLNIGANQRFLGDLSMVFVLLIPKLLRKLFKIKITDAMEFTYVIFVILAQFLGSVVNLYNNDTTWWYDLFTHFSSGVLTTVLALVIMSWLGVYKEKNKWFNLLFMVSFTLMIASLWEFLEFGTDTFLGMNVQHSLETGVRDTMEDMLIAFLGSIIVSVTYLLEEKKKIIKKIVDALK